MIITSITALIVLTDYLTKHQVIERVSPYERISVLPFLNIIYVENKGAAFGLFHGLGNHIFMTISVIAIAVIIIYLLKIRQSLEMYSLSLILGGAVGNLIDRLRIGKVIDFIDVFVGDWHWPAFNVADSALTVGIILFAVSTLLHSNKIKEFDKRSDKDL